MIALRERLANKPTLAGFAGLGAGLLLVVTANQTSPWVAGGVMAGLILVGAAFLWPTFAFLLTAIVVPLERIGRFADDSVTYNFSLMRVLGVVALGSLLLHWMLGRRKLAFPAPVLLYFAFTVLGALSLTYTTDWEFSVRAEGQALGNLLFLFLIVNVVKSKVWARRAIGAWLLVTFLVGLFTIYQWHNPAAEVTDTEARVSAQLKAEQRFSTVLSDTSEYQVLKNTPRALGPTSSPAVYAINVILALPFYLSFWRSAPNWPLRLLTGMAALVACYNVILTNTRAAVITLAITLLLALLTGLLRVRPAGLLVTVLLALVVLPFTPSALYDRVFDIKQYTTEQSGTLRARLMYWQSGLDLFLDHWVLGIGYGNQSEIPKRVNMPMPPNSSVHNEYLESLLELGLLGYSVLVMFFISLYRRCRFAERSLRAANDQTAWMLTATRVAFWSVLFFGVQVDVLHFPLKGWWLVMGLAVALSEMLGYGSRGLRRGPVLQG